MLLTPSLATIDTLNTDALVLFFTTAQKGWTHTTQFLDFRLCGQIASLWKNKQITGNLDETILLSTNNRINAKSVFCFGLGDSMTLMYSAQSKLQWVFSILEKAKVTSCAFDQPYGSVEFAQTLQVAKNQNLSFEWQGVFNS